MTPLMLSPHFSFHDLTVTRNAALQGFNRTCALAYVPSLRELCGRLLDPIHNKFPDIVVTSGFRCPELNGTTAGAAIKSQHMKGEAADIWLPPPILDDAFYWTWKDSSLAWGQLILEQTGPNRWIHISLGVPWRPAEKSGQVLAMKNGKYERLA